MIVQAISNELQASQALIEEGWSSESVLHVSLGKQYEVQAIIVSKHGSVLYCIVDDAGVISYLPACIFLLVTRAIPSDWMINQFPNHVSLIVGPTLFTESEQSYIGMVEGYPEQMQRFWGKTPLR